MIWIILGALPLLFFIGVLILEDPGAFVFAFVVTAIAVGAIVSVLYGLTQMGVPL